MSLCIERRIGSLNRRHRMGGLQSNNVVIESIEISIDGHHFPIGKGIIRSTETSFHSGDAIEFLAHILHLGGSQDTRGLAFGNLLSHFGFLGRDIRQSSHRLVQSGANGGILSRQMGNLFII
ncbi:MAG: hypothetical protein BWY75_01740 [bacterium ADurb.Bin425]|nr:MAG: hypothetical protein BWY75_01740 [bacterium ADurb.Bin425]